MGPQLIVDKSALQMIGAHLIDELTMWFDLVATPTLYREIIGNLKKHHTPKKGKLFPQDILRSLAAKLQYHHAATPSSFKAVALGNLMGRAMPMNGFQIPVDETMPNVHSSADGKMLMVDGTMEQAIWARWARGDFSPVDERMAEAWRNGVEKINMNALGVKSKAFVDKYIGKVNDIPEIIDRVDVLLNTPNPFEQARLAGILLRFLGGEDWNSQHFLLALSLDKNVTMPAFAPFSSSILRIYLVFISALSLGFVKRDSNSIADLQYLFYAPFANAFASNDKLHHRLFQARAGNAIFVSGPVLKADLEQRIAWRKKMSDEEWAKHRSEYGIYPMEFTNSIITEVWSKSMRPREEPRSRGNLQEGIEKVSNDPKFRDMVARMRAMVDESRAEKSKHESQWPFGNQLSDQEPSI